MELSFGGRFGRSASIETSIGGLTGSKRLLDVPSEVVVRTFIPVVGLLVVRD